MPDLPFRTDDAGTGELSWGQRAIWEAMRWLGDGNHYFNLAAVVTVPTGRSIDDVRAALQAAVERHQALRTTFPGYPAAPRQRVHDSGRLPLSVEPAGDDPDAAALELNRRLRAEPFAHQHEWPLRAGLVSDDDGPRRLVLVVSHLATDGTGLAVLQAELTSVLTTGEPPAGPPPPGPLALAAEESTGTHRSAASMRHWRTALRDAPPSLFDYPQAVPEDPRFLGVTLESPALAVATTRLAAELRCTTAAVLMAGVAVLLGHYTGHDRVALQVIAGNRWDPALAQAVAPLAQNGIFALPMSGPTFHDAVRAAAPQGLRAFRAGAYDPRDLATELASARATLGAHVDREAFVNDVRRDSWDDLPATDDLASLRPSTRVAVTDSWDRLGVKTFFYFRAAPDRAIVHVQVDTAFVRRTVARALLCALEELVVRSVTERVPLDDLTRLTGLHPVRRDPSWVRHGAGYLHLPAVSELLAGSALVREFTVVAEPDRVVAQVVPAGEITTAELHADLCEALGERTDVHAPGHYVLI